LLSLIDQDRGPRAPTMPRMLTGKHLHLTQTDTAAQTTLGI
jgi:hypothetical protein